MSYTLKTNGLTNAGCIHTKMMPYYWQMISNSHIPPWGVVILHIGVGHSRTPMCKTTPHAHTPHTLLYNMQQPIGNRLYSAQVMANINIRGTGKLTILDLMLSM